MGPGSDDIRRHLERVLASSQFASAGRLSRFLRYVAERTLAGEADQLKEYVVGTEVFDRNDGYDPRIDSIVRVEAGRLRAKLDEYYNGPGKDDAVRIRMPRGGYTLVFEPRGSAPPGAPGAPTGAELSRGSRVGWRLVASVGGGALLVVLAAWAAGALVTGARSSSLISIAVLPIEHYSAGAGDRLIAERLTDGIIGELARLRTLAVVSRTSTRQFAGVKRPLTEVAQALGADLVLESSVTIDGEYLRVDVRLVDAVRDRKVWARVFTGTTRDFKDIQERIARDIGMAAVNLPGR